MGRIFLPLAILLLGALAWACTSTHTASIEAGLLSQSEAALSAAGITLKAPASLNFGSPATLIARLRGYKGSPEISAAAVAAVRAVPGVVDVVVEEIPRPPAEQATTEITEVLKLENVEFVTAKADLTDKGKATLDKIAAILAKVDTTVGIGGHTDSRGREAANLKLSQQRADTTKAYLVGKGIAAARLTSVGYGASKPVADNATEEGRARNRRIEFDVKEIVVNQKN